MELVIFIAVMLVLGNMGSRSRFWNPFRGAPDLKSTDDANAVSEGRMSLLRSVGQITNALAVNFGLLLELLEAKFGSDQAHAFLASCATTVAFRCASKKTAEYVVGRMGNQEGIVLLTSSTSGHNANSSTTTQHLQIRATVLADEVLHAPLADPVADTMTFWTVCPTIGNAKVTTPFIEETTVDTDPNYPNICARTPSANGLRPLTRSDWVALGLPLTRRTQQRSSP